MEAKGSYNTHAKLPADGAALALPLLEKAVQSVEIEPDGQAIWALRRRIGPNRAISVFHIDQPSNEFATLFAVFDGDPDRYVMGEPNVFPEAIGRSFYQSVLPQGSVHLGWSSYAAVWLSEIPPLIPGHFFPALSTGMVRTEFDRQGAKD
jgi:hypothetical protein